jgi:hypothetical protein
VSAPNFPHCIRTVSDSYHNCLARNVRARLGGKEDGRALEILRLAPCSHGDASGNGVQVGGIGVGARIDIHVSSNVSGEWNYVSAHGSISFNLYTGPTQGQLR